ncbi:MAG: type II toxin-antitoxin system prevent-host-death family antitoxin [Pseudomonadota bacterium]
MQASIRELRQHTKELLDAAMRGERVIVTYHDQEYIQLVPVQNKKITEKNEAFGMWKDDPSTANVDEFINQLRRPRHAD